MSYTEEKNQTYTTFALVPSIISTESARVTCGTRFVVSSENGDILPRTAQGFYSHDTRFLSQFIITVNGKRLSGTGHATFEDRLASFYCTVGSISVVRDRYVSSAFHEDISITSYYSGPVIVSLEVTLGADFADVFEVRRGTVRKTGQKSINLSEHDEIIIRYRRDDFLRETRIKFSRPARIVENVAQFNFKLSPKEVWRTCVDVQPVLDHVHEYSPCINEILGKPFGEFEDKTYLGFFEEVDARMPLETVPVISTDDPDISQAYYRAVGDLRALRLQQDGDNYVLAAGLPWFMAVFGRDSIISAIQTKLVGTDLMVGTLRTLARLQAKEVDSFREAEPGKIIHEVRRGELSYFGAVPHTRYYGTIDATPLFIILLGEAYQWTGDKQLLRDLLPSAELALDWIDKYGDLDSDGFIEHRRRISKGLLNQGWKDSHDSISFSDGTLAKGPIALAEVQGYVYAAKLSMSRIYEILGNPERASELAKTAEELKGRFNEQFWMPEEEFFAIALDGKKRCVDTISSNPGHCLWSGIVSEEKAAKVARRLMAPDMFSGWGIRTLSSGAKRYNPLSYHNGSVWPHDNSIIAAGLKRYGFYEQAEAIAMAIIEATAVLPAHRLPELFAGYPRRAYSFPVPYPMANSPQAWASGSIIYLMESLLDITSDDTHLVSSPAAKVNPLFALSGVKYRDQIQALP
jgi:glycogen debranching enzyme